MQLLPRLKTPSWMEVQELRIQMRRQTRAQMAAEQHWAQRVSELEAALNKAHARIAAERYWEHRTSELEAELKAVREAACLREQFLQQTITRLEKEIADFEKKVADTDELLEKINAQLVWFRENHFASNKSEQSGADGNAAKDVRSHEAAEQSGDEDSETNSADAKGDEEPEPTADGEPKPKRPKGQQKGTKGPGRSDRSQLRTEEEFLSKSNCACGMCGKPYRCLEVTKSSPLVELFHDLVRILYERHIYVPDCNCEGNKIVTADPPDKLYDRTEIGNTVWVHLVVEKFLSGVPTNRTLKEFSLRGLHLSQGTVTGGFQVINGKLDGLYQGLINHCQGADLWNADETWWRVFSKRWWMWLVASDDAVVYLLDPSRSKKVPNGFFGGSKGVLMTDRLASYKGLASDIKKAWCWVHQRRDFLNVFKGMPKLSAWAKEWLELIATLFVLNHKCYKLWEVNKDSGKDWDAAYGNLTEHVQKMQERWENELKQPELHKKQNTILGSMKRHWEGLTLFLTDMRIPLHNNRAERLLRNSVILRKNCYGSGAQWAGEFAAKVFSIFQTWLINGLNPEALLLDYLNACSKPGRAPPDLSLFLPWTMSGERKKQFKLPDSYRRPG